MKKIFAMMTATLIGWLLATAVVKANTDQRCGFEGPIDAIRCQADELRDVFREQFRKSDNYRELMGLASDLKSGASRLESLLRRNQTTPCRMDDAFAELQCTLRDLTAAVEIARLRASRGLDPPLCGCTLHVDGRLARLVGMVNRLQADVLGYGPAIGHPRGFDRNQPTAPIWEPGLGRYPSDRGNPWGDNRYDPRNVRVGDDRYDSRYSPRYERGVDQRHVGGDDFNGFNGISLGNPQGRGIDLTSDGGIQLRLGVGTIRLR